MYDRTSFTSVHYPARSRHLGRRSGRQNQSQMYDILLDSSTGTSLFQ